AVRRWAPRSCRRRRGASRVARSCPSSTTEGTRHGSRLRGVRQAPLVGHERQPLAPAYQAPVEPQPPAPSGPRRRLPPVAPRLHRLHQGGEGHQARPLIAGAAPAPGPAAPIRPSRGRPGAGALGAPGPVVACPVLPSGTVAEPHPRASEQESRTVQGVIKAYDPVARDGIVVRDTDLAEFDLAPDALEGSAFRMLGRGQCVIFDLDDEGRATRLRLGSEVDMGTPVLDPEGAPRGDRPTSA